MEYKRFENENEDSYILRICSMKNEQGWTWQDIADILNEALGHNFGESCYRKKVQQFHKITQNDYFDAPHVASQL